MDFGEKEKFYKEENFDEGYKIIIEKIANPQTRLPFINHFTQYIPDKNIMAGVTYSSTGKESALYLIDVDTLNTKKYILPDGVSRGNSGFIKGRGDIFYIAANNGYIYEFNLTERIFKKLAKVMEESFICGIYVSRSGKIYVGRWPDGNFSEYDPVLGRVKQYETIPGIEKGLYCSDFIDLPDGRMLVLVTGRKPAILVFEPNRGNLSIVYYGDSKDWTKAFFDKFIDEERVLVNGKQYGGVSIFNWKKFEIEGIFADIPEHCFKMEKADGYYYCCGYPSGSLYKINDKKVEKVWERFPEGNIVQNLHYIGNGEFVCLGDNGLAMKLNLKKRELISKQVDNISTKGMRFQFFYKIPDENFIIGSHFINSQMFKINLKDKICESFLTKVSFYAGQINCATSINNKIFLGLYGNAVILEYDWRKPFIFGENPSVVGEIGEEQNRPISMINDEKFVYIATMAKYGTLGGAITVFNPVTYQMEVYRNFVPYQNPTCLFIYLKKGILVGGTNIDADCYTAEPKASNAVLFLWDTKERKVINQWAPWETPFLKIIDISSSGVCFGLKNEKEIFLWDIETGDFEEKKFPLEGRFIGGLFMNEHEFYCATENGFFVFDIKTGKFETLMSKGIKISSQCPRCFVKISKDEFLFDMEGVNVMKARIK